jgi:hypothetical protein
MRRGQCYAQDAGEGFSFLNSGDRPCYNSAQFAYPAVATLDGLPTIASEYTLTIPSGQDRYHIGQGTPRAIAMYAIATSNAIGTGKNAPTSATSTIPPRVTCAVSACCGTSSTEPSADIPSSPTVRD